MKFVTLLLLVRSRVVREQQFAEVLDLQDVEWDHGGHSQERVIPCDSVLTVGGSAQSDGSLEGEVQK